MFLQNIRFEHSFRVLVLPTNFYEHLLLTFKTPRKTASKNVVCLCRLLIFLQTFQICFSIQANSEDPDQTAPRGAVWSGSTLFAKNDFKNHKQMTKQTTIVVIGSLRVKASRFGTSCSSKLICKTSFACLTKLHFFPETSTSQLKVLSSNPIKTANTMYPFLWYCVCYILLLLFVFFFVVFCVFFFFFFFFFFW